jgi:DNA modification methylase
MKQLPDGCVDAVITDPPYGIEGSSGTINRQRDKGGYELSHFADSPAYIRSVVVPVVQCSIEIARCVVVTPGNKNCCLYPQPDSFGAFYQPASVGLQVFGNADAQPIFYYGKNASGKNMGVPCSYTLTEAPEKNGHPCPKPERAWTVLCANVTREGQTILDPFAGSGTTLVAAKKLGRHFLGFEISPEYCAIARDRLARIDAQPTLFEPKPEQLSLGGE